MSKLGKLQARVLVDEGSRTHYGSQDAITGVIQLTYKAHHNLLSNTSTAKLFGPLRVFAVLDGTVRTKVRRGDSHRLPTDHSNVIFRHGVIVFNAPFQAEVGDETEFRFSIKFPQDAPDMMAYAASMSSGASRNLLPPSFSMLFTDHPDVVDISIQYRLGVSVNMPGIGIDITVPEFASQPQIIFELPRPPSSLFAAQTTFTLPARIQNESLLPEAARPQGLKQKAKAVFQSNSHFPALVLDVNITHPTYIHARQNLLFSISLRRNDKESTTTLSPEIILERFAVEIRAHTIVDVSGRIIGPPQCIDRRTVQALSFQNFSSKGKSSLRVTKETDFSVQMVSDAVKGNVSSFAHLKVSKQYMLVIVVGLRVAGDVVKVKRESAVVFLPRAEAALGGGIGDEEGVSEAVEAGPSRPYDRPPEEDDNDEGRNGDYDYDQLPAYGATGSHTLIASGR